jgi:streptomycin 6-kinase
LTADLTAKTLPQYLKAWNLTDPQPLAQTPTSHVYTVTSGGERVILKLLTPLGTEERGGAVALRCYDGHGAVRLLRADEQAHLLEYADGDNLVGMVERGDDEQATGIMADVLNQLHVAGKDSPPNGLIPLRTWFRSLFKKAEADKRQGIDSLIVRAAPIAEMLLDNPRDVCVLHGDIHHENVRYKAQRGWLAYDPKGLYGERTFDTANILRNPIPRRDLVLNESRLLKHAAILAQDMHLDLDRILTYLFVFTCLSASWISEDSEEADLDLRVANIVEPHLSMRHSTG